MDKGIQVDIRMNIVDENIALEYINMLSGKWIYIKHLNNTSDENKTEQIVTYTKFKVRNVNTFDTHTILIYGEEDEDRLVIDKDSIVSYQMTYNQDELLIKIITGNNRTDVFIKNYLPKAKRRLNEILMSNENLIITEGKTDWKHLKRALQHFQKKGLYEDFKFTFFEYEDEVPGGNMTMWKVLDYNKLFYSSTIKIFIFDADEEKINEKHEGKNFVDWGNNIYSFIIPVPDFRKETPLISIENYYTDEEIKLCDNEGHRLYLNNEVDFLTGLIGGKDRIFCSQYNKCRNLPPNHIIDDKVFKVLEGIEISNKNIYRITQECKNIALSKNKFANYILNEISPFDKVSVENFRLIFDVIQKIQNCPKKEELILEEEYKNEIEINPGVYLKSFDNGLMVLELFLYENNQIVSVFEQDFSLVQIKISKEDSKFKVIFNTGITDNFESIISIPLGIDLIGFLYRKIENHYNRVELHLVDEIENTQRVIEILKDEIWSAIIEKELDGLYN